MKLKREIDNSYLDSETPKIKMPEKTIDSVHQPKSGQMILQFLEQLWRDLMSAIFGHLA